MGSGGQEEARGMIPIFITSFFRLDFTEAVVRHIRQRTEGGEIHLWDNGSDRGTQDALYRMLDLGWVQSLHLDSRNTGCLFPKLPFHAMVPADCEFYVVTDGDFIPSVGWLPKLLETMVKHQDLALLTLEYFPRWPLQPLENLGDYTRCKAVGNTFKLCRRSAVHEVIHSIPQALGAYGDDGLLCDLLDCQGYKVGYQNGAYCYNLELTAPKWGYTPEQLAQDPRKAGYQEPIRYTPLDWDTLTPPPEFLHG